jgi:hypothetical protein
MARLVLPWKTNKILNTRTQGGVKEINNVFKCFLSQNQMYHMEKINRYIPRKLAVEKQTSDQAWGEGPQVQHP